MTSLGSACKEAVLTSCEVLFRHLQKGTNYITTDLSHSRS